MGLEVFKIDVARRSELIYFPGETIQGTVHAVVGPAKQCVCKAITVNFLGNAFVEWAEGSGEQLMSYSEEEIYFDSTEHLLGTGTTKITLHEGRYKYPFQFTLPQDLHSSFTHKYGKVQYIIRARMVRGSWKCDYEAKMPFLVSKIFNLNDHPRGIEPVEIRDYRIPPFMCIRSGPVGFTVALPKTGFIPGDFVKLTAEMMNQSSRRVLGITVCLVQQIKFHAKRQSKVKKINICKADGPVVKRGETDIWTGKILKVPPLPPSSIPGCHRSIIEISYFIKVKMAVSGIASDLQKYVPIIIGTVPYGGTIRDTEWYQSSSRTYSTTSRTPSALPINSGQSRTSVSQSNVDLNSMSRSRKPNYYEDLPPSYSEAICMSQINPVMQLVGTQINSYQNNRREMKTTIH